ncbi:CGNR zinc finger domain-containing protein [Streptomyces abyssomicinicus]|uniref:CGNR zinc finger domain-containing protein n=1 Tax=Streptomyces abyssomicinicus TaxID=574929 RepID=UPI001FE7537B|nr:CGNR zinc finger domain-containing protein [Streptomyces abyssomicinicus]
MTKQRPALPAPAVPESTAAPESTSARKNTAARENTSARENTAVPADPGGSVHASAVSLVGGHPVLDFANTVAWRLDPARTADRVQGPEAWARWAATAGPAGQEHAETLLRAAAADPARAEAATAALVDLRTALLPVLDALVDDAQPPAAQWEALRGHLARARQDSALPPTFPLRWQPDPDRLDGLRHELALRTEELLGGDNLDRVRRCEGAGCGWFFLDRSRNATRRWCSAGDCGNRDRARRHYARTRREASPAAQAQA